MNHEQAPHGRPAAVKPFSQNAVLWVAGVLVIAALVLGGIRLFAQKPQTNSGVLTTPGSNSMIDNSGTQGCAQGGGTCSGSQGGHPPVVGTITAVSASSITIKTSDGSSKTFSITGSTQVLSGPNQPAQAYNASDFHVGETVGVATVTDNQADMILPNYSGPSDQSQFSNGQ